LGFQPEVVIKELNALKGQMQSVHSPTVSEATPWGYNYSNKKNALKGQKYYVMTFIFLSAASLALSY